MWPVKPGVSNIISFIKSWYLPCTSLYKASKRPRIPTATDVILDGLLVQLFRLGQALLLGSLLRDLAVVVRLGWSGSSNMWGNLGLNGLDEAGALFLALIDGLSDQNRSAMGFAGARRRWR